MISDLLMETLGRYNHVTPQEAEDWATLRECAEAADAYLLAADVPDQASPLRDLTLRKLATYFFEVRGPDRQYGYPALPPDLNALVCSLRHPTQGRDAP